MNLGGLRSFSYYMTQQILAARWIMMLSYKLSKKKDYWHFWTGTHVLLPY